MFSVNYLFVRLCHHSADIVIWLTCKQFQVLSSLILNEILRDSIISTIDVQKS